MGNEIKDSMVTGFQVVTAAGVLCDEGVRSMRINVNDTTLHPDSIHRGGGQIIPTSRRVFYACQLTSAPRLQEPYFLVEITCPNEVSGSVYSCLTQKRGEIEDEPQSPELQSPRSEPSFQSLSHSVSLDTSDP